MPTKGRRMQDSHEGAWIWENCKNHIAGYPSLSITEFELFTDTWITNEMYLGPYEFINGVPRTRPGGEHDLKPSIVVRVAHHTDVTRLDLSRTNTHRYHGGWIYDEVAALTSLVLGARVIAGPVTRSFSGRDGPLGRPHTHAYGTLPSIPLRTSKPTIPWLFASKDLSELSILSSLPKLNARHSVALVKSARLFQQALYVCDSSPEISWLLLVSAIETAAATWSETFSPAIESLRSPFPKLADLLESLADESLARNIATELARITGATGKFCRFCETFRPLPPAERPDIGRFNFEELYSKSLVIIYRYRSEALHSGIPFPFPMCMPPEPTDGQPPMFAERPMGLGAGARGSTWEAKDTPMHLHLFASIVRGILLNWWSSSTGNEVANTLSM